MSSSRTDGELLADFAGGSHAAFAELVSRHSDFVYSAALRQTRDPHLAEDVSQAVFILLAQKAGKLSREAPLMGWLHNVARYAAANALRQQRRREHHERAAARVELPAGDSSWEEISPAIDPALAKLGAKDRDAVLLRYFRGKSHKEVAEAIGVSESAAKMRIGRALEKLRSILSGHNLTLSAAGIEQMIREHAIVPTPRGLAERMANPGFLESVDPTVKAITQGANQMMMWTRMKTAAAIVGAIALLAGGAFALVDTKPAKNESKSPVAAKPADPATKPPATAPAASDKAPKEVAIAAFEAAISGDADTFIGAFAGVTAQEEATLKQVVNCMSALQEIQKAMEAKFGADEAGKFKATLGVGTSDLNNAEETITGDAAIVNMGNAGPGNIPMVKTADGWKVRPEVLRTLNTRMVAQMNQGVPQIKEIAKEINDGKLTSIEDVQQALAKLTGVGRKAQ